MKRFLLALIASSTLAMAQPATPPPAAAPDYAADSAWLCLPGRGSDPCGAPLATAALDPAGYGPVTQSRPAIDAPVDCFYVYPTVSTDRGLSSDMSPGAEERGATHVQFARFHQLCRTFAPIYRQVTLGSFAPNIPPAEIGAAFDTAYGDVRGAWRAFLATRNQGRPFILVGHSQGSIHLERLIREEIEGKPAARLMVSAMLIGWNVEVPQGRDVGGSLPATPLCTRPGQTGCVVTYVSFRDGGPPPAGALFGRAARPGNIVGCTNPAALGGGRVPLESIWYSAPSLFSGPTVWSRAGPPPAPFLRTSGLVSAQCVNDGAAGYLAVRVEADPADARTDDIPGEVITAGRPVPAWGLHLADMNLAMGDLLRLAERQIAAFLAANAERG